MNVPFLTSGGGNGPSILVTDLTNCRIAAVETSFTASTADLAATTANNGAFAVGLFGAGQISNFLIRGVPAPLTGTTMGTTCFDLNFKDGGVSFITATPPYAGTFAPFGSAFTPSGTFIDLIGQSANGTWDLPFYNLGSGTSMSVDCWVLKLTVN